MNEALSVVNCVLVFSHRDLKPENLLLDDRNNIKVPFVHKVLKVLEGKRSQLVEDKP